MSDGDHHLGLTPTARRVRRTSGSRGHTRHGRVGRPRDGSPGCAESAQVRDAQGEDQAARFARHITCHTARRLENEFWNGPWNRKHTSRFGVTTLDRFPGWKCINAAGGGSCTKGAKVSSYTY